MKNFDDLYDLLLTNLNNISNQFLIHIDSDALPLSTQDIWNLKSYVTFAHAMFEDFFEKLALEILHKSINQTNENYKKTNDVILHLIKEISFEEQASQNIRNTLVELIKFKIQGKGKKSNRNQFVEAFQDLTKELQKELQTIIKNNHGIKIKFLKKMYSPLGIDFDNEIQNSSINSLGVMRGELVHKSKVEDTKIQKQINLKDTENLVNDCKELAKMVINKAKKFF